MNEQDLTNLYCSKNKGTTFLEVSVGEKNIKSNNRLIDIVRVENQVKKCLFNYSENKEKFFKLINCNYEIEIVEVKPKLNRCVIGQIIVGEYLFKRKFNINKFTKTILYHVGDELLEQFCKENGIKLIKY